MVTGGVASHVGWAGQPYDLKKVGSGLVSLCNFVSKHYAADTVLFHQGYDEARTFLIETGWGKVHKDLPGGERQIVELPIRGDLVGHFTNRSVRHETFSSLTEMTVWEGPASAFMASLADTSPIADQIFAKIALQRTLLGERLADIGQRNAVVRTLHFLLELGVRLERVGISSRRRYECPLTQYDLAATLGMTAVHVNRSLREMRELGLVEFRHGRVEFLNYTAAVAFADFDDDYLLS